MRIFEMAPYAFFENETGFVKNNSGLAFAVSDICTNLRKKGNDVFLITQSGITNKKVVSGISICSRTWIDIFRTISIKNISIAIRAVHGLEVPCAHKLKVILYFLSEKHIEKQIELIKPHIAHIHGISLYTIPFMLACINKNIPFIITNHGLATWLDKNNVIEKERIMERNFFELANQKKIPITVVSNGIKKRVKKAFNIDGKNIHVVLNGYSVIENDIDEFREILDNCGINKSDKLIICVGSISDRKNQIQVLRAFRLLVKDIQDIKIIFAGNGPKLEDLKKSIISYGLEDCAFCVGFIDHRRMTALYKNSTLNVTASLDEGFGLPIIEALSHGIPSVCFSDIDAVEDLYHNKTMVLAKERTDESLYAAMKTALLRSWDSEFIKKHATNYSIEHMIDDYVQVFNDNLGVISDVTVNDILKLID